MVLCFFIRHGRKAPDSVSPNTLRSQYITATSDKDLPAAEEISKTSFALRKDTKKLDGRQDFNILKSCTKEFKQNSISRIQ